jgi:hypothetical protein
MEIKFHQELARKAAEALAAATSSINRSPDLPTQMDPVVELQAPDYAPEPMSPDDEPGRSWPDSPTSPLTPVIPRIPDHAPVYRSEDYHVIHETVTCDICRVSAEDQLLLIAHLDRTFNVSE